MTFEILVALLIFSLPNNLYSQKRDYNKAINTNTIEGYISFLKEHPKSEYYEEINVKLITLEYENLKIISEISSKKTMSATNQQSQFEDYEVKKYKEFLVKYPNTQYQEPVRTKLKELEEKREGIKNQIEAERLAREQEEISILRKENSIDLYADFLNKKTKNV